MRRITIIGGVLLLFLCFAVFYRSRQEAELPERKLEKVAKRSATTLAEEATLAPKPLLPEKTDAKESAPAAAAEAAPSKEAVARETLLASLKRFATLKTYSFDMEYRMVSKGQELLSLSCAGRVRDHQFAHAMTSYSGAQSEVISNGLQAMIRPVGTTDEEWQVVETGFEGMEGMAPTNPAAVLEMLQSEVMNHLPVEAEGEQVVNGKAAMIVSIPWEQQLADEESEEAPVDTKGRIKFTLDPKSKNILQWTMESSLAQADDPTQNLDMTITTRLSGFDQDWTVALPDTVKDYLAWK